MLVQSIIKYGYKNNGHKDSKQKSKNKNRGKKVNVTSLVDL